jgi:hypothetical protein
MHRIAIALAVLLSSAASAQEAAAPAPAPALPAPAALAPAAPSPAPAPLPEARDAARPAAPTLYLAPKLGAFIPTSRLKTALFTGVEAGYVPPVLDGALSVQLDLSWTRPKGTGTLSDPQLRVADSTWQLGEAQFGVQLSAVYRFRGALDRLTPYLGGGPGLFWHRAAITAFAENSMEREAKLGLQALGGAELNGLGPGLAFLEAQYRLARVDFVSTGFTSLGGVALAGGYRLTF